MTDVPHIQRPNRALQFYAALFLIVLYVPILLIPLFAFNDSIYVRFPLQGFTTQWFVELWNRQPVWDAFWNSIRVGIAVSIISTILGVITARAITRYRMPGKTLLVSFIMTPLIVPSIIFGVALLVVISRVDLIRPTLYTVALGHVIVCLPFAVATLIPRFEGFDASIEEASADLGENGWWTFWRVTFPGVMPGIVASMLLTFVISFDEFVMAFFLSGNEVTLPILIWSQLRFSQQFPSILALATLILFFSIPLILLAMWINRLGLAPNQTEGDGA